MQSENISGALYAGCFPKIFCLGKNICTYSNELMFFYIFTGDEP
jgi:hypothetical protein